jgi:hypothetical protein
VLQIALQRPGAQNKDEADRPSRKLLTPPGGKVDGPKGRRDSHCDLQGKPEESSAHRRHQGQRIQNYSQKRRVGIASVVVNILSLNQSLNERSPTDEGTVLV